MTTCMYCRAQNAEDDHRCHRCGRRLQFAPPPGVLQLPTKAATALRLQPQPPAHEPEPAEAAPQAQRPITYQRSLFSSREVPQVVPFESLNPAVAVERRRQRAQSELTRPRPRKPIPGQQALEFSSPPPVDKAPGEGVIYCDAPVALPAHRVIAAAVDCTLVLIAFCCFCAIFGFTAGGLALTKQTIPLFICVAAAFALVYKVLWCLADGDTPGMRSAHLRLVNFDGQKPDREQRIYRMASGVLSLLAAGLGVLWALVDEEALTWHDHISKTFPTPY